VSNLRLAPLDERWLDDVAELVADPLVRRFTRIPEPPPQDFARSWIDRYGEGHRDGTCEGFAVVDGDGRFVGLGLAPAIDRRARELELGYIGRARAGDRDRDPSPPHRLGIPRGPRTASVSDHRCGEPGVAAGRRAVWLPARRRHAFDPREGRPTDGRRALVAIADGSLISWWR
jgi:hypothetical protein